MKYQDKLQELAQRATAILEKSQKDDRFELRVDARDPDLVRVFMLLREPDGRMETCGAQVAVAARPSGGKVRLVVDITCTFCSEYGAIQGKILGFLQLEHVAQDFCVNTLGKEYEA